jgi:UrcA family protein
MQTTQIRRNRVRLAMFSAAVAVLARAGTGQPAWGAEPMQVSISYADLNMESAAGLRSLYGRLKNAARHVCSPLDDGRHSPANFAFLRCYETALDSAVAKVNRPVLTAMHNSRRQEARG